MRIQLKGAPEDLIRRCESCDYCIFEDILPEEQRKIKVLDLPIPENHPHRTTIEYICGRNYDKVCPMKYAAMRSSYDDFMASQLGAIKDFIWDLGKKNKRKTDYNEAMKEWTKVQNLGNGREESYAERFRIIWEIGLRKNQQILTAPQIYEIVIASPEIYKQGFDFFENLKKEHQIRDKGVQVFNLNPMV